MAMAIAPYRRPGPGDSDALFRRCLAGASTLGALFLAVVLITPIRERAVTSVGQIPQRLAKLILEEPKPKPAPVRAPDAPAAQAPEPVAADPKPEPVRRPPRERRPEVQKPDPDAGRAGRERAQQAVTQLASATATLEKSLQGLSTSLQSASGTTPARERPRRGRSVRAGRSSGEIGSVQAGIGGGTADLAGSSVGGTLMAVGELSSVESSAGGGGGDPTGSPLESGSGPGVYRSNASLLAVVQRYAAGIQFCYENELKHDESLSGKLVVAITVSASGAVTEVSVVRNSVRSTRLEQCALSQIRDWKFPSIERGTTTFRAPFVFTPPQ